MNSDDSERVLRRFWPKVNKTDGCWLWTGCTRRGYGAFHDGKRMVPAHRFLYEIEVGPVPADMEIDHVKALGCANKNCVRPSHLEAVPHRVNILRAVEKAECPAGHPYSGSNLHIKRDGSKVCRTCRTARKTRSRRRKAAALTALDTEPT